MFRFSHFLFLSVCVLFSFFFLSVSPVVGDAATPNTNANLYAAALTLQIEPREEACFYEDLENGKTFRLEFEVVRGGLLDIKVKIFDPQQNTVLDKMAFFNRNVSNEETRHTHRGDNYNYNYNYTHTHMNNTYTYFTLR